MKFCAWMRHLIVQLMLVLHLSRCHSAVIADGIATITSFMIQSHAPSAVVFTCWKKVGKIRIRYNCSIW